MTKWKVVVTEYASNARSRSLGEFATPRLAASAAVVHASKAVDQFKRDGVLCYFIGDEHSPSKPVTVKSRTTQRVLMTINVEATK